MDIKDFEKPCMDCKHTRGEHYEMVQNPENNPKAKAGVCKVENCSCRNFWESEKKHESIITNEPKHESVITNEPKHESVITNEPKS